MAESKKRGRGRDNNSKDASSNDESNNKNKRSRKEETDVAEPKPSSNRTILIKFNNNDDDDETTTHWYQVADKVPGRHATLLTDPPPGRRDWKRDDALVHKYRAQADSLYRQEVVNFNHYNNGEGSNNNNDKNKDIAWIQSTISKGTLKDRIAAMSVVVSTHPVHKFYALDGLLQLCTASDANSRVAQMAAEALQDIFLHTLLPANRKLIPLSQRPWHLFEATTAPPPPPEKKKKKKKKKGDATTNDDETEPAEQQQRTLSPRVLLLWRFEEMVSEKYHAFLTNYIGRTLRNDSTSKDTLPQKVATLRMATHLLASAPQGETVLLPAIVNKLGDPAVTVASAAADALRQLLHQHGAMQTTVAREVQQLVHRPHVGAKALYLCICFLNQLQFRQADLECERREYQQQQQQQAAAGRSSKPLPPYQSLPASLIATYFRLFEAAVAAHQWYTKGGASDNKKQQQHQPLSRFQKRLKRQRQKRGLPAPKREPQDPLLQTKLLSALLTGVNRAHPYLQEDDDENVQLQQHVDSLYRVVFKAPAAACTQALLLLFHLHVGSQWKDDDDDSSSDDDDSDAKEKKKRTPLFHRRTTLRTEQDEEKEKQRKEKHAAKQAQQARFYNALYSRLTKLAMFRPGKHLTLFFNLLYKALKYDGNSTRVTVCCKQVLATTLHAPPPVVAASLYLLHQVASFHKPVALCLAAAAPVPPAASRRTLSVTSHEPLNALVDETPPEEKEDAKEEEEEEEDKGRAAMWELSLLLRHFHPVVAHFATGLGQGFMDFAGGGDPLRDFGLGPLLEKWSYRDPKALETIQRVLDGKEQNDSRHARRVGSRRLQERLSATPLNAAKAAEQFYKKSAVDQVQEAFIWHFFNQRKARHGEDEDDNKAKKKKKKKGKGEDYEEAGEEEALYRREAMDFDAYAQQWESDEEEEAFVDGLAQKIMDDAALKAGGRRAADMDGEDPDTSGWDDMYDDDDDGDDAGGDGDEDDDDEEEEEEADDDDDEEEGGGGEPMHISQYLADESTDEDDDDDEPQRPSKASRPRQARDDDDDDAFMQHNDSSDSDDDGAPAGLDGEAPFFPQDDNDEDESDQEVAAQDGSSDLALLGSEDEDEDDDEEPRKQAGKTSSSSQRRKQNRLKDVPVYAAMEEYQERINEEWAQMTGASPPADGTEPTASPSDDDDDEEEEASLAPPKEESQKKKKKKKASGGEAAKTKTTKEKS